MNEQSGALEGNQGLDPDEPPSRVRSICAGPRKVCADGDGLEELRRDRADLQAAQALAQVGSWDIDLRRSGRFADRTVRASAEMLRIFGLTESTPLTSATFLASVHDDDRSRVGEAFRAALAADRAPFDCVIVRPGGERRFVRTHLEVTRDERGAAQRLRGATLDITDSRRAADELAESRAFWRAMAKNVPDIVLAIGADGNMLFLNRDVPPVIADDVVGRSWRFIAGKFADRIQPHFEQVLRDGIPVTFDAPSPTVADVVYACLMGPIVRDGHITGAIIHARDVSELRRQRAQMMMADRLASVGTLAAGVAHEINNLLSSVKSNIEVADSELSALAAPAGVLEPLRDALLASDRVQQIVRDLKMFSRVDEEARTLVDVAVLVSSTLRLAAKQIEGRARLSVDLQAVPAIEANQARLGQVVLNLVINALQAVPEGAPNQASIRVSTRLEGNRVVIAVADTGCGIPEASRPYLFQPFFTTKPSGVGTGLGLSICQQIVNSLGGTIEYTSVVGEGTEFRVLLPVRGRHHVSAAPPVAPAPRPTGGRHRILIIDDEPLVRRAAARILRNYDVTTAGSAEEAIPLLRGEPPFDLVLCDLMMPGVTGIELYNDICRDVPAYIERMRFMTGGACTDAAAGFLVRMTGRYVEKPFSAEKLRAIVEDWCADQPAQLAQGVIS